MARLNVLKHLARRQRRGKVCNDPVSFATEQALVPWPGTYAVKQLKNEQKPDPYKPVKWIEHNPEDENDKEGHWEFI